MLPRLAFFTCHHHLPRRDLFLQPDYLRHANGAKRGGEVIFLVRVRRLIEAFSDATQSEARAMSGGLCFGPSSDRIVLLRQRIRSPAAAVYRLEAANLDVVKRQLQGR